MLVYSIYRSSKQAPLSFLIHSEHTKTVTRCAMITTRHRIIISFSRRHIANTINSIRRCIDTIGWKSLRDLQAEQLELYIARMKEEDNRSHRTLNAYIRAMKGFTRWCMNHHRLRIDPLSTVSSRNEQVDQRYIRRTLSSDELCRLLESTQRGPDIKGIAGSERALFYRLLLETGLRRSEAEKLTENSFRLEEDPPTLVVTASSSKSRKEHVIPLGKTLTQALKSLVKLRGKEVFVWTLPDKPRQTWLIPDLERAGIEPETAEGILDFHSFRHTFVTRLADHNVPLKLAQDLARHSNPNLTMNVYAHTQISQRHEALNRVFGNDTGQGGQVGHLVEEELLDEDCQQHQNQRDDSAMAQRIGQRNMPMHTHIDAQSCMTDDDFKAVRIQLEGLAKLLEETTLEPATPHDAPPCVSEYLNALYRTRTYDPLIKSQLLCQLS